MFKISLILLLALLLATILLVLPWRWIDPPGSAFMWQYDGRAVQHHWVPRARISTDLAIAVIAAEDQKFPQHFGFDFAAIADALQEKRRRPRGASTLSQQVAKNLFLWGGRSYLRKALEAYLTFWIELLWPKTRILEIYLNIAEFGKGVYGAEAASRAFFYKPAAQLTAYESALLAAVLPNPKRMSAARPSPYVHKRAQEILRTMRALGGAYHLKAL